MADLEDELAYLSLAELAEVTEADMHVPKSKRRIAELEAEVERLRAAIIVHLAADFGPDWNERCREYPADDLSARLADALTPGED